jgi:hypothetical protein
MRDDVAVDVVFLFEKLCVSGLELFGVGGVVTHKVALHMPEVKHRSRSCKKKVKGRSANDASGCNEQS